jgi:hypothetical protein
VGNRGGNLDIDRHRDQPDDLAAQHPTTWAAQPPTTWLSTAIVNTVVVRSSLPGSDSSLSLEESADPIRHI